MTVHMNKEPVPIAAGEGTTSVELVPVQETPANISVMPAPEAARGSSHTQAMDWLQQHGLSEDGAAKVYGAAENVAEKSKVIAAKSGVVGKTVMVRIIEFAKGNPNLALGMAIGVGVSSLVTSIPLIGPFLAPVAVVLGTIAGHRLDEKAAGKEVVSSLNPVVVAEDMVGLAKKFFRLLIDIFNTIFFGVITGNNANAAHGTTPADNQSPPVPSPDNNPQWESAGQQPPRT
jgi:hypothetical protein